MTRTLRTTIRTALLTFSLVLTLEARAQAPSNAPAGTTGICKDGTWSNSPKKDGACRGHKGVQTWYAAPAKPVAPAMPAPVTAMSGSAVPAPAAPMPGESIPPPTPAKSVPALPAPAPASAPKTNVATERAKLLAGPPAPGGGPGLVWLNGSSKVYHCSTDEFYGKTKTGSYVTEGDARAKGAHPSHNKPCS